MYEHKLLLIVGSLINRNTYCENNKDLIYKSFHVLSNKHETMFVAGARIQLPHPFRFLSTLSLWAKASFPYNNME